MPIALGRKVVDREHRARHRYHKYRNVAKKLFKVAEKVRGRLFEGLRRLFNGVYVIVTAHALYSDINRAADKVAACQHLRPGFLTDGILLTREHRLIRLGKARYNHTVRENLLSCLDNHQITENNLARHNLHRLAAADNAHARIGCDRELFHRRLRAALQHDSNQDIRYNNGQEGQVLVLADTAENDRYDRPYKVKEGKEVGEDDFAVALAVFLIGNIDLSTGNPLFYLFLGKSHRENFLL